MNKSLVSISTGSLEAYTNAAYRIPVLTAAEEPEFAKRWSERGNVEAARRLEEMRRDQLRDVLTRQGTLSGQELVQDRADRVNVGTSVDLLQVTSRLLG